MISMPAEAGDPHPVTSRRRAKARPKAEAKGARGNHFPVLDMTASMEPALNTAAMLYERMHVSIWRKLLLLLRYQSARQRTAAEGLSVPYRRPRRWLATLFSTELAGMWGHLGNATRTMRGPRGLEIA